jgi:hypothetical protein
MRLIAIDPGVSGALAVASVSKGGTLTLDAVHDLPVTFTTKSNNTVRRRIDAVALHKLVRSIKADHAFVELVHASPGMGVGSAFTFGDTAGAIRTACAIAGVEPSTCQPTAWKRALAVPADKNAAIARATELLGADAAARHWPLKKHHNRAEAALLAVYGAHVLGLRSAA